MVGRVVGGYYSPRYIFSNKCIKFRNMCLNDSNLLDILWNKYCLVNNNQKIELMLSENKW